MPLAQTAASLTQTLLAAQASTLIEPVKKNQYRLFLQVNNLLGVLQTQFGQDSAYLQTVATAMTGNVFPIEVSFTPPAIQVEQRKVRGANNVEIKYAGYVSFGNAEATFHNFIDLDTYKFFYRWASMAGGLYLQRTNNQLLSSVSPGPLPVPDFATDGFGGYKVNATVSSYHNEDTSDDIETENNRWILQGVFPTSVSSGDFSHADDGEQVLTNVSFSIDLTLPATPNQ